MKKVTNLKQVLKNGNIVFLIENFMEFSMVYLVNFYLLRKKVTRKIQNTVFSKRWLIVGDYVIE